jgi:hypothetical protein
MLVAGAVPWVACFRASLGITLGFLPPRPVDGDKKLKSIQLKKNAIAKIVVALDKNVAAPLPPKTAPVIPEPPNAPAKPSPFADCIKTTIIKLMQMITCNMVKSVIKNSSLERQFVSLLVCSFSPSPCPSNQGGEILLSPCGRGLR